MRSNGLARMVAVLWLFCGWMHLLATPAQAADRPDHRVAFLDWVQSLSPPRGPVPIEERYHLAHQLWPEIAELVEDHDDIGVERIGRATSGTPLWAFHVPGEGSATRDVLIFSGIHALEWISVEVSLQMLLEVASHRPPHVDVTVVPLLNPDGRAKTELDLSLGRNVYRRGNMLNVDLNRDFAVHREARSVWRHVLPGYHSATISSLSQPESRALDQLANRERFDRAASLHAFGGFFYFPWSGRWKRPDHWASFVHLGRAMEVAQGPRAYKTRQLSRWGFFFRAQGSEIDHLYGRYGTLAFLVELTRSGVDVLKTKDFKTYFRWYNPRDPSRHILKGTTAMWALIETEISEDARRMDARRMARRARTATEPTTP